MLCKTCDILLSTYKQAVKLYADAELRCRGMLGDDPSVGVERTGTPEIGLPRCRRDSAGAFASGP
jgi:hypothetical protein